MNTTDHQWHLKDGVLTFTDTGEQWEISHWTEQECQTFLTADHADRISIVEGLETL